MADTKISQLPVATVVNDADVVVLNQAGVTKQAARSLVNGNTVTTFTGGTTGLTPNTATTGAITLDGTLAVKNGGTGAITLTGVLKGNGTGAVTAAAQLAVADGGTGASTLTGVLKGNGTSAFTASAQLAVADGGTGQSSYTNGQLLIGNTTGNTLTKATLTGTDNVAVTNGNGSISIGVGAGAYLEFFEHFMSTSPLVGNIASAVTGGTNTIVNAGLGIIAMSTGATAAANQQSRLNQAATNAIASGGSARAIFRFAQSGATWFDGTLTGALRCGWGDSTTGESANAIYFRSQNGQGIDFITKSGTIETLPSTGVSFADGVFRNLEILVNSTGTQIIAKIDGTTVATHTTNIPSSRLIFFTHINRVAATGTAVVANLDSIYLRLTPNTPFF